jgi:hypothetical protein
MNKMLLELTQLRIQPGQQILLDRVSWQQFESILAELGERRAARVSYSSRVGAESHISRFTNRGIGK